MLDHEKTMTSNAQNLDKNFWVNKIKTHTSYIDRSSAMHCNASFYRLNSRGTLLKYRTNNRLLYQYAEEMEKIILNSISV